MRGAMMPGAPPSSSAADHAVLALGTFARTATGRCRAPHEQICAAASSGIAAVLEVDPDHVVAGRRGNARDLGVRELRTPSARTGRPWRAGRAARMSPEGVRLRVRPLMASVQLDVLHLDQAGSWIASRARSPRPSAPAWCASARAASAKASDDRGLPRDRLDCLVQAVDGLPPACPPGAHRPTQVKTSRPG